MSNMILMSYGRAEFPLHIAFQYSLAMSFLLVIGFPFTLKASVHDVLSLARPVMTFKTPWPNDDTK